MGSGDTQQVLPRYESREILAKHVDVDVPVLCAWHEDNKPNPKIQHRTMRVRAVTVGDLFPHPNIYLAHADDQVLVEAQKLTAICKPPESTVACNSKLYDATLAAARQAAAAESAPVVHYAIGVAF